ncbi:alpha/beta hydrolase [Herbihabitans rhizosphaerae]|uniref:alpha/beta hydrolase n=1 Tax=Herbihabitans rhizosphaerae TaxID=1872711 RepID=UPI0013EECF87|nr:alpha/beta hydrolase [Herbihabitans rhizosphaerae]
MLTDLHATVTACQNVIFAEIPEKLRNLGKPVVIDPDGRILEPVSLMKANDTVMGAVRRATEADGTAAAELRKLTAEAQGFAQTADDQRRTWESMQTVPAAGAPPGDVKRWWDGLTDRQRETLLFLRTEQIGSLDGVPVEWRDRANRMQLPGEMERIREDIARMTEQQATRNTHGSMAGVPFIKQEEIEKLKQKLAGLEAVLSRLNKPVDPTAPQAHLLKISTDGAGKAIVAMGNPDTATNVATFVPGTGAGLNLIGTDMNRADKMAEAASVYGQSPSTAVIAWTGYDAPQEIFPGGASKDSYADNARADLDRFQDGLRATHQGTPSHNTLIGHSYGSTVIGHAARDGSLAVDNMVFVGSPGVGVDHVRDLHLDGVPPDQMSQRVHATTALHDIIRTTPPGLHSAQPIWQHFGAHVFESNPGTNSVTGFSTEAHSEYWNKQNRSLENMGRIIAGQPTK